MIASFSLDVFLNLSSLSFSLALRALTSYWVTFLISLSCYFFSSNCISDSWQTFIMNRFYSSRVEKISMRSSGLSNLSGMALSESSSGSSMIALSSAGMSKSSIFSWSLLAFWFFYLLPLFCPPSLAMVYFLANAKTFSCSSFSYTEARPSRNIL